MKTRTSEIIIDCAKSALGLGISSWLIAAIIRPSIHFDYTNTEQLFVLGTGAVIGAVLSYIFREDDRSRPVSDPTGHSGPSDR
jgi:hypothetical protein